MTEPQKEIVQIVFVGHFMHKDRTIYLLRKFIPHKVYFVRSMEEFEGVGAEKTKEFTNKLIDIFKKELPPWVAKKVELIELPFFNFNEIFPRLVEIIAKEKKKGNEVIINLHGATLITAIAVSYAASLTGAQAYWILPEKWVFKTSTKGELSLYPEGAKKEVLTEIPLKPELPRKPYSDILIYLYKKNSTVKTKLKDMVADIGIEKLSMNLKKTTSGIVKLSKLLQSLRNKGIIETKKIGRKVFEVSLTEKGKMIAKVLSILE